MLVNLIQTVTIANVLFLNYRRLLKRGTRLRGTRNEERYVLPFALCLPVRSCMSPEIVVAVGAILY